MCKKHWAMVPDPDLLRLEEILAPEEALPSTIQCTDIAGLVEGASRGEGLGNKFLGHVREADAILHVVRCFEDPSIVHATGAADPVRDVDIVETEFLLADLDVVERAWKKVKKAIALGKGEKDEDAVLARVAETLRAGRPVRELEFSDRERTALGGIRFLTAKPCLYVANTGEDDPTGEGPLPAALREARGADRVLAVSVRIEEEVSELPPEEQAGFLEELGLQHTALDLVIAGCYRLLDLITFYTIANDKLRAWPLRRGGTAPEAAGKIHSDMETGFIRAEVMGLDDLVRLGSRHELHDHGLIHTVGRDHVVQDRDVLQIHFHP